MHKLKWGHSKSYLIVIFSFFLILMFMENPVSVSAKAKDPEVKISNKTIYVGDEQYRITVSYLAKSSKVTCESDNNKIAKVDKNNNVIGINQGKTTIYVTIKQAGKTYRDKIAITVKNPKIVITEYVDSMEEDTSATWKTKIYGRENAILSWSSSDTEIASVDENTGKVEAHSAGKVVITVKADDIIARKTMVVKAVAPLKAENEEGKETVEASDFTLQWDTFPEILPVESFERYCIVEENLPCVPEWSVSDPELAKIDQDGWINTAYKTGTVLVTVKVGDQQISKPLKIITEEDYTYYVRYKQEINKGDYSTEFLEEDTTKEVAPTPTPVLDMVQNTVEIPEPTITVPAPVISPRPVITPSLEKSAYGYTYNVTSDGIVITGLQDKNIQNALIPSEMDGKKVVRIRTRAFSNLASLQSIIIPDTVTVIEFEAIKDCPSLSSLTIPTSVIEMSQINGCPNLKDLTIGIEKINNSYFRYCTGLERITVLEGVKEIGGLKDLHNLKEVSLPQSLQVISRYAFANCTSLVRINIPSGVTEVAERAFSDCISLTGLSISNSFDGRIGDNAFDGTPVESIAGAYKYHCMAILSDADILLFNTAQSVISSVINASDNNGLKALAIHDWIVKNTEYDEKYENISYSMEGVLLQHRGVCNGYAETFKLFMDLQNIPCELVVGMTSEGYHAWNLVYLDGAWYHIDCTFDDPTPDRGPNGVLYSYCFAPDFVMEQVREWDRTKYPAANGTKWTDYVNDNLHSQ